MRIIYVDIENERIKIIKLYVSREGTKINIIEELFTKLQEQDVTKHASARGKKRQTIAIGYESFSLQKS